jgi:hypothetical protein
VIIGSLLLIFAAVVMLGFGLPARSDPLLIGSIIATLFAVIVLIGSARRTAALRLAAGTDAPPGDGPVGGRPTSGGATVRPGPVRSGGAQRKSVRRPAEGAVGTVIEGSLVEEPVTAPVGSGRAASGGEAAPKAATAMAERTTVAPPGAADDAPDVMIPSQTRPTIDLNDRPAVSTDSDDGEDYADGEFSDEDPPGEPPPQLVSAADAALVATMDATVLVVDGRPRYHRAGCAHLRGRATEPLPVSEAVELGFTPCSRCEPDTALIAGARPS